MEEVGKVTHDRKALDLCSFRVNNAVEAKETLKTTTATNHGLGIYSIWTVSIFHS